MIAEAQLAIAVCAGKSVQPYHDFCTRTVRQALRICCCAFTI